MKFQSGVAFFACVDVKQATAYAARIGGSGPLMVEFNGEYIPVEELAAAKAQCEAAPAPVEPPAQQLGIPAAVPAPVVVPPTPAVVPEVVPPGEGVDASGDLGDPAEEDK